MDETDDPTEQIELRCKVCGNSLDYELYNDIWTHDCFNKADRSTFQFACDPENRVYLVPIEVYQSAMSEQTQSATAEISDHNEAEIEESVINSIFNKRPLWDPRVDAKERTSMKKKLLWKQVSEETGIEVEQLQKMWNSLYKKFSDAKNERTRRTSGSAAKTLKHNFRHYESMTFLNDIITPPPTITPHASLTDKVPQNAADIHETINHYNKVLGDKASNSKKRSRSEDKDEKHIDQVIELLKENSKPPDEVDGFLIQAGHYLRKIPEEFRLEIQIDILSYLQEKIHTCKK